MKVLHIYRSYFPDLPGGVLEVIRQVCHATRALGASTEIFALSPQPSPRIINAPEGRVIRSRSWIAPASCDMGGPDAFLTYRRLALNADVLHFHYPWPFADLLYLLARVDRPAVVTYHSDVVRQQGIDRFYAPLRHAYLSRMQAVIATSPAYRQSSAVLNALPDQTRVVTIPIGLAEPEAAIEGATGLSANDLPTQPYFLFVGVLRYYKGLEFLIEAARLTGLHTVIVGTGPQLQMLQALAAGLPNVQFAGVVSDARKFELIRHCCAMVLPSHLRSEAFGVALIEAAMCGTPMISCEIGTGTSYVNLDGVSGIVVPPEDPAALGRAMKTLASEPERRRTFGAQARARYQTLFSSEALGEASMTLYQNVLAGRPAGEGLN